MSSLAASRSAPQLWLAGAPLVLKIAAVWLAVYVPGAIAGPHEASQFSVPSGSPDDTMQASAAFARELDPAAEVSFRDAQSGSLSVSRVEGNRIKCIVRVSPDASEALKPLDRFLNGRHWRRVWLRLCPALRAATPAARQS